MLGSEAREFGDRSSLSLQIYTVSVNATSTSGVKAVYIRTSRVSSSIIDG